MNNAIWTLFFDGLCEPINPGGLATYGFYLSGKGQTFSENVVATEGKGPTNNIAEYTALISGLEKVLEIRQPDESVLVHGDSQLAINQLNGDYVVKSKRRVSRCLFKRVI